ncbi:unnamed protein product [Periconia digitata]|uniref:Uncharacterized protein n=1 Tax=Periconia digitata TaxID=1303443 RepID=A0A9W4XQ38_9PLEO|nr:unnamed protein product [Periconia digitata]
MLGFPILQIPPSSMLNCSREVAATAQLSQSRLSRRGSARVVLVSSANPDATRARSMNMYKWCFQKKSRSAGWGGKERLVPFFPPPLHIDSCFFLISFPISFQTSSVTFFFSPVY